MFTDSMTTEEIITFAKDRPEFVWHWGGALVNEKREKIELAAVTLEVELQWGEPIRPGDLYLAIRNTGPKLLTCLQLGKACVFAEEGSYTFDFNECVLVK